MDISTTFAVVPGRRTTTTRLRLALGAVALAAVASTGVAGTVSSSAATAAPQLPTASVPHHEPPAATDTIKPAQEKQLTAAWLELWNGHYSNVRALIRPVFRVHAAMLDGSDGSSVNSPQALVTWISQSRAAMPNLTFSVEVGPIAQGDHLVVRWSAHGTYAGGIPGAGAPAGTPVSFTGTDILRVHDGKLAEYWVNSDTLLLLTQLQVRSS